MLVCLFKGAGGTPLSGPRSFPTFWSHVLSEGYSSAVTGPVWAVPEDRCPQPELGTPSMGLGTLQLGLGYILQLGLFYHSLLRTGYAAGGMPLAASRGRIILYKSRLFSYVFRREYHLQFKRRVGNVPA